MSAAAILRAEPGEGQAGDSPTPPVRPRRVLIVDDSAVARAALSRALESEARFQVVASTSNAAAALSFLTREQVDLILLDLRMPGVDGLTVLPELLVASRNARILVVSSAAVDGAAATVQALALGAADTLVKPQAGELHARFGQQLIDKLDRLADAPTPAVIAPMAADTAPAMMVGAERPIPSEVGDAYDIVAIGASTGGIHALSNLLRALPSSFLLPILVTQHLPAPFMPYFAAQLRLISGRPCEVATDRLRVRPGRIVIAPGDAHIRCVRLSDGTAAIRLSTEPASSGCLPSVDPMFTSLAAGFGNRVLAVVLSGMGRDGAEGAQRVSEAGGGVVVQDQASSVVWGMPGAVAALGLADAVLPPADLGRLVASRRRP